MHFIFLGLSIILIAFMFNVLMSFFIGKLLFFAFAAYFAYILFGQLSKERENVYIKLIIWVLISAALTYFSYAQVNSKTACDGYYIGGLSEKFGPKQSGVTITHQNYDDICHFPGIKNACKSYRECKAEPLGGAIAALLIILSIISYGPTARYLYISLNSNRSLTRSNDSKESNGGEKLESLGVQKDIPITRPEESLMALQTKSMASDAIASDYENGLGVPELMEKYNKSKRSIVGILSRRGVYKPKSNENL